VTGSLPPAPVRQIPIAIVAFSSHLTGEQGEPPARRADKGEQGSNLHFGMIFSEN
jgi:hypothetical protein